jgi:uncharacterized protein YcbK (DUF882 family)
VYKIEGKVRLIRLPEAERDDYYDPHPDRGDSGVIKIDGTNGDDYIASFLQLKEFRSKDGKSSYLRVHPSLIFALQLIKWYTNANAVEITSGYRTKSWNASRGGKRESWHMDGLAVDIKISIPGKTTKEAYQLLKEAAELVIGNSGGVGCYPEDDKLFVHIDTRGTKARWGKGCR